MLFWAVFLLPFVLQKFNTLVSNALVRHDALNFKDVRCRVVLPRDETNFFVCGVDCYVINLTFLYSNFT